MAKKPPANAGDVRDLALVPGSGRSPGGGHGSPLQYSCLENPMDRRVWWTTVQRVTGSRTGLKQFSLHAEKGPTPENGSAVGRIDLSAQGLPVCKDSCLQSPSDFLHVCPGTSPPAPSPQLPLGTQDDCSSFPCLLPQPSELRAPGAVETWVPGTQHHREQHAAD